MPNPRLISPRSRTRRKPNKSRAYTSDIPETYLIKNKDARMTHRLGGELEISATIIKELRGRTSAGVMDCKRALEEAGGDLDKAQDILTQKGIASAVKKAARSTEEGVVESYIHSGGRIGVLVEVNCETDFVARTADFQELAHDVAMQIAAMDPRYVDSEDVPDGEDADSQETVLMNQPFIKDPAKSISDLVKENIGKLGENIRVRRFTRFSLGE